MNADQWNQSTARATVVMAWIALATLIVGVYFNVATLRRLDQSLEHLAREQQLNVKPRVCFSAVEWALPDDETGPLKFTSKGGEPGFPIVNYGSQAASNIEISFLLDVLNGDRQLVKAIEPTPSTLGNGERGYLTVLPTLLVVPGDHRWHHETVRIQCDGVSGEKYETIQEFQYRRVEVEGREYMNIRFGRILNDAESSGRVAMFDDL